nr:glycoside hydrolase family 43 protein [Rhodococcus trifolii]
MDTARVTSTRMSRISAVSVALLVLLASALATPAAGNAEPSWRYTMVAFSNVSDRDMDVYQSADGTNFESLQRPAYRPPTGLVRDPSIFRNTDGMYYLTYTTAGGANIGFARSSDRVNWTHLMDYPVPFCCIFMPGTGDGVGLAPGSVGSAGSSDGPSLSPFVTKAWAPEWFVDGNSVNVILSLSTGGGFVPYVMTAMDPSLSMFSMPVPLVGLGADRIDTTVVKIGSDYHAITKNETKKVIEHAIAPTLAGPYRFIPGGADWGTFREGPSLVQLPNDVWRLYFDGYTDGKYFYTDSSDGLRTWTPVQELPGVSGTVRHFGVMREPS